MLQAFRTLPRLGVLALAAAIAGGCSDTTGMGDVRLTLLLTDAPTVDLESATVTIGAISILADDDAPIPLTNAGGTHDLLELQGGVTTTLASLTIPAGTYLQLRLEVTAASVVLADPFVFVDGSTDKNLKVPSGAQSGIKINLSGADGDGDGTGIEILADMVLVVDFDVSESFVIQGNPNTPAGISGVLFTPLLRAAASTVAG